MKYFIKQMILGKTIALPLDEVQFETLKISQNILSSAMAIEEKYDLLVSNFLGKVRTSIPRTKNENFSHLISMGYQ
ncbi:hypothetical protein [Aeromonas veronii]|uniref:hypothetical protein n=1 Tax=Aeromonas veronii TaxID=654 RepID=UPI003D220AE1